MIHPAKTTVTAHTGCMNTKPNTLESIVKGFDTGADIIEIDVRFNRAGEPILTHNPLSADEEKMAVKLADTFDIIKNYPDKRVNIDIKEVTNIKSIELLAKEKGIEKQIFFTGIWPNFVDAVKSQSKNTPYYLNYNVSGILCNFTPYIKKIIAKTKNASAIGINLNKAGCSKKLVDEFRKENLLVSVWTITDKANAEKYLAMNPDNITCKNPDEVLRIIGKD